MNIFIKPLEICNLNCRHCYNQNHTEYLGLDILINFLNNCNMKFKDNYFILHGGEPMLNNINYLNKLVDNFPDNKWRITTNLCYELDDEKISFLKKLNQVRVSFDIGIRFNNIKNLLLWYKNIKILNDNNIHIILNICLTSTFINKIHPLKLLRFLKSLKIKEYRFERITETGNAKINNYLIADYLQLDNWLCLLYKYNKLDKFKNIYCGEFKMILHGILNHPNYCYGIECCKSVLTVNSNGTIGGCPNEARDNIFGNIKSNLDDIIMEASKFLNNNCKFHKTECLTCEFFSRCREYCRAFNWQNNICPYPKKLSNIIYEEREKYYE